MEQRHPMGAAGLAWADYRPGEGTERCATCDFYKSGDCRMFQTTVDPAYVCDEWQPTTSRGHRMDAIDERAVWSTAYMNDLPDSSFLIIESGGKKDSEGKTTPRSLRHFPVRDKDGNVDLAHLRNALARIPQSNLSAELKAEATKKAQALLKKHGGEKSAAIEAAEFRHAAVPLTHVEVRDPTATPDDTWTMSGYAAVFNRSTVLYDGNYLVRSEEIDPGFFEPIFRDQPLQQPDGVVHFNLGHDMNRVVAATNVPAGQPGSLILRADAHGLHFLAKTSRDDPDAKKMAVGMRDGYITQASFAFTIAEKQTSTRELEDGRTEERDRLMRAGRLYDVCATPQGAYPQASSQLARSYVAAFGQSTHVEADDISAALAAGVSNVSPSGGVSGAARRRKFEAQIMRDELRRRYR